MLASDFGASQRHRAVPVLRHGRLAGMLDRDALGTSPADARARELFRTESTSGCAGRQTCRAVATRLAVHGIERLPVVGDVAGAAPGDTAGRRLAGIVSHSDLIKATAGLHDEEHARMTLRGNPLCRQRRPG